MHGFGKSSAFPPVEILDFSSAHICDGRGASARVRSTALSKTSSQRSECTCEKHAGLQQSKCPLGLWLVTVVVNEEQPSAALLLIKSTQLPHDGTPTAFGAALWLGVTPEELLPAVVANFIKQLASVEYRMDTVGFIGVRYIFEALAKVNRTDVALKMLNVTDYPSFGYQITNTLEPATSLWESYVA